MIHVTTPCPKCGAQMAGEAEKLLEVVVVCPACGHRERVSARTVAAIVPMLAERNGSI